MTEPTVRSLLELVRMRADVDGERHAYHFLDDGINESAALSYEDLDRRARMLSASIREYVDPGAAVVLSFPAGLDFLVAFCACLYADVVAVPVPMVHPQRGRERLEAIVADCSARLALTTAIGTHTLGRLANGSEPLARLSVLSATQTSAHAVPRSLDRTVSREALAFLQYTSGSTQRPRGVCVTHASVLDNLRAIQAAEGSGAHTRSLTWLPHFHDMGLIEGLLQPLYGGYPAWMMPPAAFLQRPVRWLQAISKLGISVSGGPNFAYELCLDRVRDEELDAIDLRTWQVAYCGAEPVRAQTMEAFARRFAVCGFKPGALRPVYGMAEATLLVAASRPGRDRARILYADRDSLQRGEFCPVADDRANATALVSCGSAIPGSTIAIVEPASRAVLPPGKIGEIWVSGPSLAKGYRGVDQAEAFLNCDLDGASRRWLRTGDLGFLDEGEVVVTGRAKDLIIVRGRKLHPHDLEDCVRHCFEGATGVSVAAFAMDGAHGEELGICVEILPAAGRAQRGEDGSTWQVLADRIHMALYRQHEVAVASLAFVPSGTLPRTSSGKLMRYRCRSEYIAGRTAPYARFDTAASR